jgi:mono/diheme cytochrome c family protein
MWDRCNLHASENLGFEFREYHGVVTRLFAFFAGAVAAMALAVWLLGGITAQHHAGPVKRAFMFRVKQGDFWLRAPRVSDPVKADGEAVDSGQAIYANSCSSCHNADGKGTEFGLSLYPEATDLTTKYAQGYSDRELYYLLWNGIGHTAMPRWDSQLQPTQVWQVIHYLRTMPGAVKGNPETADNAAMLAEGAAAFWQQGLHGVPLHRGQAGGFARPDV